MSNSIIKFDATTLANINTIDDVNAHINKVLASYDATKNVVLDWEAPSEDKPEPMTLSKLVAKSQDGRLSKESKEGKAARTAEFRAIKAIFINEGINDLIEGALRKLGYQARFEGASKTGVATMKFVPPTKQNDVVGKAAGTMKGAMINARIRQALIEQIGKDKVVELEESAVTFTSVE
jgi:hypothetical protein